MRLSQFVQLKHARYTTSKATAERIIQKYLNAFWKEDNLPVPEIKLVKRMGVGWVARDVWNRGADNTRMELNVHLVESDDQLEKVIAHELIHHWQFLKEGRAGHEGSFKTWMQKINAKKGADFVTKDSNEITTQEVPEFFVLIKEVRPGTYGWMWAKRPSKKQQATIETLKERGWKLTKSKKYELSYGPKIGPRGAYSTTDQPDLKAELEALWKKAA